MRRQLSKHLRNIIMYANFVQKVQQKQNIEACMCLSAASMGKQSIHFL